MALLSSNQGLISFELNTDGVRELLRSDEVLSYIESIATERCPEGCVVDTMTGTNRVNARITTETAEAYQDNLENNTLLRSIS